MIRKVLPPVNKTFLPKFQEPSPHLPKTPVVVAASAVPTPAAAAAVPMEVDNEDSMDAPPSVSSTEGVVAPVTPATLKKVHSNIIAVKEGILKIEMLWLPITGLFVFCFQVKTGKKCVTPYILFSAETRRIITDTNKGCSFGEISRIVGDKVRCYTLKDLSLIHI